MENPLRYVRWISLAPARSLAMGAAFIAVTLFTGQVVNAAAVRAADYLPGGAHRDAAPVTAAGTVAQGAPAALTETPEQAHDAAAATGACFATVHSSTFPPLSSCLLGDTSATRSMVLAGDSHAAMWLPAMNEFAKAEHLRLYWLTKGGCAMDDVRELNYELGREYAECDTWRTQALQAIAGIPDLALVVMTRNPLPVYDASGTLIQTDESQTEGLWRTGAAQTLAALKGHAAHIVFLRNAPVPTEDVLGCLTANLNDPAACNFPAKGNVHLDGPQWRGEKAAAAGSPDVSFVDPLRYICPRSTCPAVDNRGVIIYRDRSHLTWTFTGELGAVVEHLLGRFVPTD